MSPLWNVFHWIGFLRPNQRVTYKVHLGRTQDLAEKRRHTSVWLLCLVIPFLRDATLKTVRWGHMDAGYAEAMIAKGNHGKVIQRRWENVLQCDTKLFFHLWSNSHLTCKDRWHGLWCLPCSSFANDKNQFPLDPCLSVTVLVNALLLWRGAVTTATRVKRVGLRLVYSCRGSIHYHHSREPGSMKASMMVGKALTVWRLDLQAAGTENPWARLEHLIP